MHSDEDADGTPKDREDGHDGRGDKIGVGGGDDAVTRIQLAARWSEGFAPEQGDSLPSMLKRFRVAYDYLDSVLHGVEPVEPEVPESNAHAAAPSYSPPPPSPQPEPEPRQWSAPPAAPEPEARPWS